MVTLLLALALATLRADTLEVEPELLAADAEEAAAAVAEHFQLLAASKLDLNRADAKDLLELPGISVTDVDLILAYRKSSGRFRTLDDLQAAGLSSAAVRTLRPFIEILEKSPALRIDVVQRWTRRMDLARGFLGDSSAYVGDPNALATRVRFSRGQRYRAAATLEKDAGEPWTFGGGNYGYDFAAGHLSIEDVGPIRHLIVGDFAARLGEGLLLQQGATMAGAVESAPPRIGRVFRPYSSTAESGFFRGVAVHTREVAGLSFGLFFSRRRLDGAVDTTGAVRVASSGYHRTASERSKRRLIREDAAGAFVTFQRNGIGAGVSAFTARHDGTPSPRSLTSFLSLRSRTVLISTEAASRGGSVSLSATAEYAPSARASLWVRWMRTSGTDAVSHTPFDRAEIRRDAAMRLSPSSSIELRIVTKFRRQATPRFPFGQSSSNGEIQLVYRHREWIAARLHIRQNRFESAIDCPPAPLSAVCSANLKRRSIRLQLDYTHSDRLRTRARIEASGVRSRLDPATRSSGVLLFEDVRWRAHDALRVDFRLMLFDVGSYDARIYSVEDDVLYAFSSPAPIGRGRRMYALLTFAPGPGWSIQVKYSATSYEDVSSIGSGADEIQGSRTREIKVQMRWALK